MMHDKPYRFYAVFFILLIALLDTAAEINSFFRHANDECCHSCPGCRSDLV